MKKIKGLFFIILLVTVMTQPYLVVAADQQATAEISKNGDRRMPEEELQQRANKLRTDIEQRYKDLANAHRLTLNTSIADVVGKHIQIGMSFENAEGILDKAGFTLNFTGKTFDTPHLTAMIDLSGVRFSKTEVVIYLLPAVPNDFHSNVAQLSAIITHAAL